MNEDKGIMKYESVLPADFQGVFYFSNNSDEDFTGTWGGKGYRFPAQTTSPMIMPFSPLEIQHIRKKFAKDYAEREFFKSQQYKVLSDQEGKPGNRTMNSIHQAATYNLDDLTSWIQECLEPLKEGRATVQDTPKRDIMDDLHKDEEGNVVTEAVDRKKSLREKALKGE